MRKFGKTIKLFLIDGEPNGRMTCELSNWTGKAYKIPRIKIKDSYDREELQNTGVYLLFGKNTEGENLVYIGEAETIIDRLKQHVAQKEFWNEVICFISKDENLNKAHIKYVESRLYEITEQVGRYKLENNVKPTKSTISESEQAEMEEFIDNIRLLTNTLGHPLFESLVNEEKQGIENQLFYIKASRGTDAIGLPSINGFIVRKGSKWSESTVPSLSKSLIQYRMKLLKEHVVQEAIFLKDHEFSSPSTAAAIVLGRNANGLIEWKLEDGTTLKEYEL